MRPSKLIGARTSGNTVTIFPIVEGGAGLYFGGASVQVNAIPKDLRKLSSLTAVIEKGKKGIVAVCVSYDHGKSREEESFFLQVKNETGTAEIDLTDPWYPEADRLGQVHAYGYVTALVEGKWYCSEESDARKMNALYLPDGNLLCQYIANDIPAQKIFDAVSGEKKVSVEDLTAENAELGKRVKWLEREVEIKLETIQKHEEKIVELTQKLDDQTKANDSAEEKTKALQQHAKALRDILEEINSEHDDSFGIRKKSLLAIRMCLGKGNREWSAARTLGIIPAQ